MVSKIIEIFRPEALDHYYKNLANDGDVLRLSPGWIRWAYPLVLVFVVLGFILMCVLNIHQYAEGPAIIRASDRTDLTATVAGIVKFVDVQTGQTVAAGDTLIRLEAAQQRAELQQLDREYERQMTQHLRNPTADSTRQTVSSLHLRREAARRQLAAYTILAPHAGVIRDVRTRPGQQLQPGQVAATLLAESPKLSLVALLPGHFRPQLSDSLVARFMPSGYSHTYQSIEILSISEEVIGPNEARRYLGAAVADAMVINGPVVVLEARLPELDFRDGNRLLSFHDGMQGTLEVRLASRPIILSLLPALKQINEAQHD